MEALYIQVYEPPVDDASHVLKTFPIVKRQAHAKFGSSRTKDLILAYMNALDAGDTEAQMAV